MLRACCCHDEIEFLLSSEQREKLAKETLDKECKHCKNERQKRILVAKTEYDMRFNSDKFEVAPAIFLIVI